MRHTERLDVGNFLDQPAKGTRTPYTGRPMARESSDVQFVDDRLFGFVAADRLVTLPVVVLRHHHSAQRGFEVVPRLRGALPVPERVAHRARPWIEQHLLAVEAQAAARRLIGPVHAPGITGADRQLLDQDMPEEKRAMPACFQGDHLEGPPTGGTFEQQQLDVSRMLAENREIHPARHRRRAGGVAETWLDRVHGVNALRRRRRPHRYTHPRHGARGGAPPADRRPRASARPHPACPARSRER